MNNQELIRMALLNLKRRKVRTFLAVAGVIIGTAAIVVMMSLGIGLSQSFTDQIKSMGNLHVIDIYPKGGGTVPGKNGEGILNKKNVATIGKIPGVSAITPIEEFYVRMSVGKFVGSVNLIGMDPEMMSKFGYKAAAGGRILQGGDKFNLAFGQDSPGNFMDSRNQKYVYKDESGQYPMNLMGDKIVVTVDQDYMTKKQPGGEDNSIPKAKYPEYKMKSVGIIDDANYSTAYSIFTSLEAVEKIKAEAKRAELAAGIKTYGTQTGYSSAKVYVDDIDKVAEVNDAIKGMEFYTNTLMEALNEMKKNSCHDSGDPGRNWCSIFDCCCPRYHQHHDYVHL